MINANLKETLANYYTSYFEGFLFIVIINAAKMPMYWGVIDSLRFFSPIIFLTYLFIRYRCKINFKIPPKSIPVILLFVLYGYSLLSLFWSSNVVYGTSKLISLNLIELPLIVSFILLYEIYGSDFLKVLQTYFIGIGVILTIFFFVTGPFGYVNKLNEFGFTHVGYGRFISFSFLLAFNSILLNRGKFVLMSLVVALLGSGLILSGLRGALISVLFTIIFILFKNKVEDIKNVILRIVLICLLICLIVYIQPSLYNAIEKRIENLATILESKSLYDDSINARIQAYTISFKMFLEKPLFGQGIGGFDQLYKNDLLPQIIKYPHNLFVEIIAELGLFGFVLFILILSRVFEKLWKSNDIIILLFINSLLLSFFSGNLTDQKILIVLGCFIILSSGLTGTDSYAKKIGLEK